MPIDLYSVNSSAFNITADPHFFFESCSHKEALAALAYGTHAKKGIVLITGEVGTGKTTLCKVFLNGLASNVKTSVIFNYPNFSETQLLSAVCSDFGIKGFKNNRFDLMRQLNDFLLSVNSTGANAVLIVDEAQNLSFAQLEQIRLLSNLETTKEKLLQVVLIGQPELKENLKSSRLRQIRQRIFVKHELTPLDSDELKNYVEFRLQKAGLKGVIIEQEGYELAYIFSQGIPRLVNMLLERALLLSFVRETSVLSPDIFRACIKELE